MRATIAGDKKGGVQIAVEFLGQKHIWFSLIAAGVLLLGVASFDELKEGLLEIVHAWRCQ